MRRTNPRDQYWRLPRSREEAIEQIELTYELNRWNERERSYHLASCGLEPKALSEYTNDQLKVIIRRFRDARMILYK